MIMSEREVWQRVMAGREAQPAAVPRTHDPQETLSGFIRQKQLAVHDYVQLNAKFPSAKTAGVIMNILSEERRHLKRLAAAYYILTGSSPAHGETAGQKNEPRLAALRRLYLAEEKSAESYLAAAAGTDSPRLSAMYRELAEDEKRHAESLGTMIENALG